MAKRPFPGLDRIAYEADRDRFIKCAVFVLGLGAVLCVIAWLVE